MAILSEEATEENLFVTDVLHISSTDLRSWTTSTLPYKYMAITTYQSKFVLIGGRNPSTDMATDQLLTSTSCHDWQPSLPPMPTKRDSTTAISAKSPDEILVVACGLGKGGIILNTVEVLLENQWSIVDPLLIEGGQNVQSALHGQEFYFLGEGKNQFFLYTSTFASLISACRKSRHTGRSRQAGRLWKQLVAHDSDVILASYSSRLISISRQCSIYAYSSMSKSWVEPTSRGNVRAKSSDYVAAAVLSTGELIIAHEHAGVHRVKLSGK